MAFDLQWVLDDSVAGRLSVSRRGMAVLRQALTTMEALVDLEPEPLGPDASREEILAVLDYRAQTPGRLPGQKLETADGWLIHPEECALISEALRKLLEDPFRLAVLDGVVSRVRAAGETLADDRKFLEGVATFCRRAAAVGGFRVR